MKSSSLFFSLLTLILLCHISSAQSQTYNTLWIPDTLSGTNFSLTIKDTLKQFRTGNQTITGGINNTNFWGPTLFFNKGDTVRMNVKNTLNDSTTLHWHGIHLPAVMDGGPHQVIPPGTTWQPFWKVTNNAATYWYHPHLHEKTEAQTTAGVGGFIIVRDSVESSLNLPRIYGVDDIPLVINDRRFSSTNQFILDGTHPDVMLVNGVLNPQYSIPAQVVRFRILNSATQRCYNLGFSDNRAFYVITSDGGLLDAPVPITRYMICSGERIEVLVNCTSQQSQVVNLMAYNSTLASDIAGTASKVTQDALSGKDFQILRLNITSPTAKPVTTIPTALTVNKFFDAANATITRTLSISDFNAGGGVLKAILNNQFFDIKRIDYQIPLNSTEIWEIRSTSTLAHPFHIHDVQFHILSRNGSVPPLPEQGWKDEVFVRAGETIRFITQFNSYSDPIHPFMYHCHFATHEDQGMMGQFVVTSTTGILDNNTPTLKFSLYPNPANDKVWIKFADASTEAYYVTVTNALGRAILMLPQPQLENGIDVANFASGVYFVRLMDKKTKAITMQKFIKQ